MYVPSESSSGLVFRPDTVAHTCRPSTQEAQGLDDREFEASLDCTVRLDLKKARSVGEDP